MLQAIKDFLKLYTNCLNAFYIIAGIMLFLFVLYFILSFFGCGSLKKINKILYNESGDDIIKKIEATRLSKRFAKMWDDYYVAYCSEDTVSLNSYLIKDDLLMGRNVFKLLSRACAIIGFSLTAIGIIKIPGLWEAEKFNLFCLLFALIALEAFLEVFYAILEDSKKKRITRYLEQFNMLAMRKLPGRSASFEARYVMNKLDEFDENLSSVRSGINQLNARMDRQYNLLNKTEKPE